MYETSTLHTDPVQDLIEHVQRMRIQNAKIEIDREHLFGLFDCVRHRYHAPRIAQKVHAQLGCDLRLLVQIQTGFEHFLHHSFLLFFFAIKNPFFSIQSIGEGKQKEAVVTVRGGGGAGVSCLAGGLSPFGSPVDAC
jgi:hypothetical protein